MPFELSLNPEQVTVPAGQTEEIAATIRNLDDQSEEYTVEVLGLDRSVYQIANPTIEIGPQETGHVPIVLCPPAGGNIRSASYPFRVRARSSGGEQNTATATVAIAPALALKLEIRSAGRDRFELNLQSEAGSDMEVELKAEDPRDTAPAERCDYLLDRTHVRIGRGETVRVPLRVRPRRRPILGLGRTHPFTVSATPEIRNARSEMIQSVARSSALIPWWLLLLLVLVILLGVGFYSGLIVPQVPPAAPQSHLQIRPAAEAPPARAGHPPVGATGHGLEIRMRAGPGRA